MDGQSKDSLYLGRLTATLAGVFITLATLLSRFSLYGIVSYSVTQRTTEIGIRMALGAYRTDVICLILRPAKPRLWNP